MDREAEVYIGIRHMIDQGKPGFVQVVNYQMQQEQPALDAELWFKGKEKVEEMMRDDDVISRAWKFH